MIVCLLPFALTFVRNSLTKWMKLLQLPRNWRVWACFSFRMDSAAGLHTAWIRGCLNSNWNLIRVHSALSNLQFPFRCYDNYLDYWLRVIKSTARLIEFRCASNELRVQQREKMLCVATCIGNLSCFSECVLINALFVQLLQLLLGYFKSIWQFKPCFKFNPHGKGLYAICH